VIYTVLVVDTETTGIDPTVDRVLEIAWSLYSVEHTTTVLSTAVLIHSAQEANPAEAINRIPLAACRAHGQPLSLVLKRLAMAMTSVDAVVAHSADFDRSFLLAEAMRLGAEMGAAFAALEVPWVCSKEDLAWPLQTREGGSLVALALEHGLGVAHAHRAGADVELLTRLFDRVAEAGGAAALRALLARGLRPKALFQSTLPFEQNDTHKAKGFRWEAATKRWLRRMAIEDAEALGWARRVEEPPSRLPGL